jgi:hypothetical protein
MTPAAVCRYDSEFHCLNTRGQSDDLNSRANGTFITIVNTVFIHRRDGEYCKTIEPLCATPRRVRWLGIHRSGDAEGAAV